jgi:hypothetical protein
MFNKYFISSLIILSSLILLLTVGLNARQVLIDIPTFAVINKTLGGLDKIVLYTNGPNNPQTIYEAKDIQTFAINKQNMLVSVGPLNKTSMLYSLNLSTKKIETVALAGTYFVSEIVATRNKFALSLEEVKDNTRTFQSQLGIYNPQDKQLALPKSELYATDVVNLKVNPLGNLVMFSGFNSYRYVIDIDKPESIKKLDQFFNYSSGFVDDISIMTGTYNTDQLEIYNLETGSKRPYKVSNSLFQEVLATRDAQTIFYTIKNGPEESKRYKIMSNNLPEIASSEYSYENIAIDNKSGYISYEGIPANQYEARFNAQNNYIYKPKIFFFSIKNKQIIETDIVGMSLRWMKT